jgi:predicted TIM-barrel fold metal-dependent hydrolase
MGDVNLNFKPAVPVFDANMALGRRHDRRVSVDTVDETLKEMNRSGVDRALVYAPHAVTYDSEQGNSLLLETIHGDSRLVPQFVCNPAFDDFDAFTSWVKEARIRAVRMVPGAHSYPFRDWVVKRWLDWFAAQKIPVWLPTEYEIIAETVTLNPSEVYDTVKAHPDLNVVLSEVHYRHVGWALPLIRSLPNISIEISRFVIADPISRLIKAVGEERILFGSRFPSQYIAPHIYRLHHSGLGEEALKKICSGNLQRLLGMSSS